MKARELQLGTHFIVQHKDGSGPVEVVVDDMPRWGLVHNCAIWPCYRADTLEQVLVELHIDTELEVPL